MSRNYGINKEQFRQLIGYLTHEKKIQRVMGWFSMLFKKCSASVDEYGVIAALVRSERQPRSLIGPLPLIRNLPEIISECIVQWCNGLRAQQGKRQGIVDFFGRMIRDLELSDGDRDLLFNRIQNARSKAYPLFKWKSEVIRQLKKFEKLPAALLYKWFAKSEETGVNIPDLIQIVAEMNRLNIPDGPTMITLEKMRNTITPAPPHVPPPAATGPTKEEILAKIQPAVKQIEEIHKRMDPIQLLRHVYGRHPPRRPQFTFQESQLTSATAKKFIRRATLDYHPDKQSDQDLEWRMLCESIIKCINVQLNSFN